MDNLEQIAEFFEERIKIYSEEETKYKAIFEQLLINDEAVNSLLKTCEENTGIDPIKLMQKYNIDNINPITIQMAQIKELHAEKDNNMTGKLVLARNFYKSMNDKLVGDIENVKRQLNNITEESTENISTLERKLGVYKEELRKFQKKNPWLNDPTLDLQNIVEETNKLKDLRDTKNKLLEELSIYGDLKPDLKEAAEQLANIKKEYTDLCENKI